MICILTYITKLKNHKKYTAFTVNKIIDLNCFFIFYYSHF